MAEPGPDLAAEFRGACAEHGPRTALVGDGGSLTYAGLAERVQRRAAVLDTMLGATTNVGLYSVNSVDYVVSYYALVLSGRLPFLLDAQFGRAELDAIRTGCGLSHLLVEAGTTPALPADVRPVPDSGQALAVATDPAPGTAPVPDAGTRTCRFTSGSTGSPKCLEFSDAAVVGAARSWLGGTGLGPDDRVLCLASLSNGLAFNTSLLPVLLAGAQLHLYRGLPTSRGVSRAVERAAATRLVAFPLVYRVLAEAAEADLAAFGTVGRAVSAAAALAPEIRSAFESRYGVRIADYYGIAEAGPCTWERDPEYGRGLGSELPGVSLRIVPLPTGEREIRVRTGSMATRYLNAPGVLEQRTGDGYLHTGDAGAIEDGRLFVTGRIGGPINLAGRKVDPSEVERIVRSVDGVADAVVFADADASGETVLHAVVAGASAPERQRVLDACRASLAPYKVPGLVSRLATIPRSTTGKVSFTQLRDLLHGSTRGRTV